MAAWNVPATEREAVRDWNENEDFARQFGGNRGRFPRFVTDAIARRARKRERRAPERKGPPKR